jgi:hypothetical protein
MYQRLIFFPYASLVVAGCANQKSITSSIIAAAYTRPLATVDELEASLRAKWDRDTLAVYADHLQSVGELRGELIVIDLRIEEDGPLPELVARREELLAAWLRSLPPGKVQHGFLDIDATGGDPIEQVRAALETGGAPYIRTIAVVGPTRVLREAVALIAAEQRPSLARVVLRQWNEGQAWTMRTDAFEQFIAATPGLHTLEVDGYRVFEAAVHPALRRLRISGWSAIESLWGGGPTWPALEELDFAFACHLGERYLPPPPNRDLLSRERFAALRSLDLSRNEPGEVDPINLGGTTNPFAFLRQRAIGDQLVELRLPSIQRDAHVVDVRAALLKLPKLERLEIRGAAHPLQHPTARITYF